MTVKTDLREFLRTGIPRFTATQRLRQTLMQMRANGSLLDHDPCVCCRLPLGSNDRHLSVSPDGTLLHRQCLPELRGQA